MSVSAGQVKELRERTGIGMMECKRALQDCGGDLEAAILRLRESGQLKAERRAGRAAAEGVLALACGSDGALLLEVNCETDFVGKDESFRAFAQDAADAALAAGAADAAALAALPRDGGTFEDARLGLVQRLGENIRLRRVVRLPAGDGVAAEYLHGGRIGALVRLAGGDAELARDLAMHVAASAPQWRDEDDVPADALERERAVLQARAERENAEQAKPKPPEILEKMVAGRLRKFLAERTLAGQKFVKDPERTVAQLLQSRQARVDAFVRLEVGEGLERRQEDFAEEVRRQAEGG